MYLDKVQPEWNFRRLSHLMDEVNLLSFDDFFNVICKGGFFSERADPLLKKGVRAASSPYLTRFEPFSMKKKIKILAQESYIVLKI